MLGFSKSLVQLSNIFSLGVRYVIYRVVSRVDIYKELGNNDSFLGTWEPRSALVCVTVLHVSSFNICEPFRPNNFAVRRISLNPSTPKLTKYILPTF